MKRTAGLEVWQSQSLVTPGSKAGQRYLRQRELGWTILLFVRKTIEDAFAYLGPVELESHRGSRPMSIVWRLEHPLSGQEQQDMVLLSGT